MALGEQHIEAFLKEFSQKKKIYGLLFRNDRAKNHQTLLDLEITSKKREETIDSIQVSDYVEGPKEESLYNGAEMWVFGKLLKGRGISASRSPWGFPLRVSFAFLSTSQNED